MRDFITIVRRTDKKVWIGMTTVCVGLTTLMLGCHRDGINDTIRAIQKVADETTKDNA